MSQQQLQRSVVGLLPTWPKTRREVLRLAVESSIRRHWLTLTGIARGLASACEVMHRVKRVWRFLSNRAVDPRESSTRSTGASLAIRIATSCCSAARQPTAMDALRCRQVPARSPPAARWAGKRETARRRRAVSKLGSAERGPMEQETAIELLFGLRYCSIVYLLDC